MIYVLKTSFVSELMLRPISLDQGKPDALLIVLTVLYCSLNYENVLACTIIVEVFYIPLPIYQSMPCGALNHLLCKFFQGVQRQPSKLLL